MRSFCARVQTERWGSLCIARFKKPDCLRPKCIWRCRWEMMVISSGLPLTCYAVCNPLAEKHKVSLKELRNLDTLPDRIYAEATAANTVVSLIAVVGAWSRKPNNT